MVNSALRYVDDPLGQWIVGMFEAVNGVEVVSAFLRHQLYSITRHYPFLHESERLAFEFSRLFGAKASLAST